MGLFSKEACAFCGTEVGMLKRSKLASKEFICNDCKRKTNYFARMDYTSKDAAQNMMETLAQEEADFEASFDSAENRFQSAERSFKTWDLGSLRVHYRCNTRLGAFQINLDDMSRYEHIPVFYFDTMIPYEFASENEILADIRRNEVTNMNVNYVNVEESKDAEGNVTSAAVVIPYNSDCIREIKLKGDIRNKEEEEALKMYELGKATLVELNDAQLALTQAQLTMSQAIYQYMTNKAAIDELMGVEYITEENNSDNQ